ncbi:hypothetical protein EYF80_021648 [Liparis tanakae]|uniref:Uncharacterized protein n=1 Tax=Liparis tanakae TaxID=230148 RepID=A0A4Z2HS97_9TELE|nr:hypothetical protein EYF80_021648 [Liparis tanakae]
MEDIELASNRKPSVCFVLEKIHTLSTQPLSSRAMPRRKGSRVSSALSPPPPPPPPLPLSSPPILPMLNDEYMQISRSLLGNDQYTIRL